MPIYVFQHPKTGEQFDEIRSYADIDRPFIAPDGAICERVRYPSTVGIVNKNAEVWEKDSDYVKKCKPKWVRRRDGVRERYDPTRHM